jgi:hypothetical protein
MRRFAWFAVLTAMVVAVTAACTTTTPSTVHTSRPAQTGEGGSSEPEPEEEGAPRGGRAEVEEEAHETQERLEALEKAIAEGRFGSARPIANHPAPGWTGEQLFTPKTDDWEPAVAADPRAPYVYMITTRYTLKVCRGCPSPWIAMTISKDGGSTWGPQRPLCRCKGSAAQYDPIIEVVPRTGAVYAMFLNDTRANGFNAVFQKSTDHGRTWTRPVHVYGRVPWTDKPELATSPNGRDVYSSWNGPTHGDLYVGISRDSGATWSQQLVTKSDRYYYAYDATVLPSGTVIFSESSLSYSGPGGTVQGPIWHHAIISRDHGATWENVIVDKVANGEPCVAEGCGDDFYTGQTSVTSDPRGHIVFAYEGAAVEHGPQVVMVRTSDDGGRTWGPRTTLSVPGENATGPRLASWRPGNARIWYMQTANGDDPDAWNVWYRSSNDGGRTWTSPVKLSDATSGAGYKTADGFLEIYGDYGEIDVTNTGKTIAVWGEGFSWTGPGGTWFNLQT